MAKHNPSADLWIFYESAVVSKMSEFYCKRVSLKKTLIKKIFSRIGENPNRKKILRILEHSKKPLNIRDIHKKIGVGYKSTYNHIQILNKLGLVKLRKDDKASGKAVTIEYIGLEKALAKKL